MSSPSRPLPIALRLATRQWLARPLRPVLCSLAIAAAVALIICVGVAMDSLRYTITSMIGQVLGVAEAHVRPAQRGTDARLPAAMLDRLRALPEVEFAGGRLHSFAVLTKGDDRLWYDVLGIDPALDERLRPKTYKEGRGLSADAAQADGEMLLDASIAEKLNVHAGDRLTYAEDEKKVRTLTVVGVLQRPNLEILAKPTIYVSLASLTADMGIPAGYNVLDLKLKDTAGIQDYESYAKDLEKRLGPETEVAPGTTSKAQLTELRANTVVSRGEPQRLALPARGGLYGASGRDKQGAAL